MLKDDPRYARLFSEIRNDIEELHARGSMSRARELAERTGQHLNHNTYPLYFTGNLDAQIALIHLNPKQADDPSHRFTGAHPYASADDFIDHSMHFGARSYGPSSPRIHRSRFDAKQIRFLRPFGVIDFVEESSPADRFTNLERVVDEKLQMELIPYGSDQFDSRAFPPDVIKDHWERLLDVITAVERRYVLFCGRVFEPLLEPYVVDEHVFRLTRGDGVAERARSYFANVRIPHGDRMIKAGLCHSWARQGIPMTQYAMEVVSRYT